MLFRKKRIRRLEEEIRLLNGESYIPNQEKIEEIKQKAYAEYIQQLKKKHLDRKLYQKGH